MNGLALQHLIRKPAAGESSRPPMLMLLHGIGSNEEDLMGLAPALDKRFLIVSARAPIAMQRGAYAWYHTQFLPDRFIIDEEAAEQSRQILLRFVDEAVETYTADARRIFLMGFSQGCIMSVAAALTAPHKFAGIVGMSGRLLPGLAERWAPEEDTRGLPALIVHGTADNIIRLESGRELRDALKSRGVDLTYIEYPMAHQVTQESIAEISRWLKQRLDSPDDWRERASS